MNIFLNEYFSVVLVLATIYQLDFPGEYILKIYPPLQSVHLLSAIEMS